MLQKITELWPGLVRYVQAEDDADSQEHNDDSDHIEEVDDAVVFDEEQLLLNYKNLYWSRLMSIDEYETGLARKWPLGKDIIEELHDVAELAEVDLANWTPLFDPEKFNEVHGPLLLSNYMLSKAELQSWAERISTLR